VPCSLVELIGAVVECGNSVEDELLGGCPSEEEREVGKEEDKGMIKWFTTLWFKYKW